MTGSIEWRGKNSCRLIVSCGMKDGKQIKKRRTVQVTGRTDAEKKRDAEKALAEFTVELERGLVIDGKKLTFKEFVDRWLHDYAENELAPKTLHRYREILNTRVLPALGHIKIDQLRPAHLIEFLNMLREDGIRKDNQPVMKDGKVVRENGKIVREKKPGGLSGKTILYHHRVISSILQDAVEWQVILNNPAARVKPPKVERHPAVCYDVDQMIALLEALDKLPEEELKFHVMVDLALGTGMRRGELAGLEWPLFNLEKCTVRVRQAA
jgi:integrase